MGKTINNYYGPVNQYFNNEKLDLIIQKLENMQQELEILKQQLTEANSTIDTIDTNVEGIKSDSIFLKNKIDELVNRGQASPAELAELAELGNTLVTKLGSVKTKTADLDASTDSSQQVPEPPVQ